MRVVLLLLVAATAAADPLPPCKACARGDELVEKLSLQPLRAIAGELAELRFPDPLAPDDYARIVELRRRTPALVRAGGLDDNDLAAVATALCRSLDGTCTETTWRALQCLADCCAVALPPPAVDALHVSAHCRSAPAYQQVAPIGVGLDGGLGYHRSRHPNDGATSSIGIEARVRIGRRLGTVARIDHLDARDAATDANGDGADDMSTGSITRISALAGPSLVFADARIDDTRRYLRLDLLGGYISTRSQPDESGPAAGFDLAHQLSGFRLGVRFVQGFGDAKDTTLLLAHIGFVTGAAPPPPEREDEECTPRSHLHPPPTPHSRFAFGGDFPFVGYGFSPDMGVLVSGGGVELAWHASHKVDALARADLLLAPGYERERTLHQAALAGIRIDHKKRYKHTGYFTTLLGGYTRGSGISTLTTAGPITDVSLGWGFENDHGAAYFRLHGRFGLGPDNNDYQAIFLSGGFELRLDSERWDDRE